MTPYSGAAVSRTFMQRWRSRSHVGVAAPWCEVKIRRGQFERRFHNDWPNPQFGRIVGRSIRHQWYADWTPKENWTTLDGIASIDLDQTFDKNGTTVATIDVENEAWVHHLGETGLDYHLHQRGYLWPWRGYTPAHRPGSGDAKNEFYNRLPNAQILVRQGYGEDTAVKTFTGLIDTIASHVRPDRATLTARDFGGVLADSHLFGWNKDKTINDPISFIPNNHKFLKLARNDGKVHRWVIINDATDIVRVILRWAGFKEWEIENSGVNLNNVYTIDKTKTYMDVINDIKGQLGYVFMIGEPSNGDRSIGRPIFRRASLLTSGRAQPITVRDKDLLTDIQPQHNNANDRYIIRVRGVVNKKIGRAVYGDTVKRVSFTYWPPWSKHLAGVIKQLTYYNIGDKASLGFKTRKECAVAGLLIAVQIALGRDTATIQTAGMPALGLDSFAYVTDAGTGIASRLYVTNRRSHMAMGGSGTGPLGGGGQQELLWATELGGSLIDNPEFEHVVRDYKTALRTGNAWSWGTRV